jgi:hypothetical protein
MYYLVTGNRASPAALDVGSPAGAVKQAGPGRKADLFRTESSYQELQSERRRFQATRESAGSQCWTYYLTESESTLVKGNDQGHQSGLSADSRGFFFRDPQK